MRLRNILPLVALLAVPAVAQDVHYGFQVGLNSPLGSSDIQNGGNSLSAKDTVDSKLGFTVGFNVPIDFNGGHTIRPRFDYTYNSGSASSTINPGGGVDGKVTSIFLGADYQYHVSGKTDGFYLLAGLGMANTKVELSGGGSSIDDNKSAFAWNAGLGWQFTPMMGMELRYTSTHPSMDFGTGTSYDIKNDGLNLSATFRF